MKRVKLLILIGGIVLGAYYGRLAYTNLRGARPAFGPPAGDIVTQMQKSSENTTGFPLALPPGFSISIFAKDLGGPRVLAFDPAGTLLVSIPNQGRVVVAETKETVIEGLNRPHGIAFRGNTLYVAETDEVAIYDYDPKEKRAKNKRKIIDLPGGGNHFSRTIGFGPDGKLYVSVGSSCNVCIEKDERRAAILVADPDGSNMREYATGLRNSVFFTWRNGQLWATDMGRDLIGDDLPPDEVNIVKQGGFYGWPYYYGKNIRDTAFEPKRFNLLGSPSHIDIPAHSAPLGLAFVPSAWPSEYRDDLLVAYHGSWNRSEPTGYKIVRMKLDDKGNYEGTEDFITGWLAGDEALGRPVDLLFDPQGTLYISDDKAGVIYRVSPSE